jgi:hypothetical protein
MDANTTQTYERPESWAYYINSLPEATREVVRQEHLKAIEDNKGRNKDLEHYIARMTAVNAMIEERQSRGEEVDPWNRDTLTVLLHENLRETIETSGCSRHGIISALQGLLCPYFDDSDWQISIEGYAAIEKILSAQADDE